MRRGGSERKRRAGRRRRRTYFCTSQACGSATLPARLTGHRLLLSSPVRYSWRVGGFFFLPFCRRAKSRRFFFPRTRCLLQQKRRILRSARPLPKNFCYFPRSRFNISSVGRRRQPEAGICRLRAVNIQRECGSGRFTLVAAVIIFTALHRALFQTE